MSIGITNIATMAVDSLAELADMVMNERRSVMWSDNGTNSDAETLLNLHDRLVVMARELSKDFETVFESAPETEQSVPSVPDHTDSFLLVQRILDELDAHGWDIDDLADNAQVRKETIDRILTGATRRPQGRTLRKIEQAFGYDEGALDD